MAYRASKTSMPLSEAALIVRAARLYYMDGLQQKRIAEIMRVKSATTIGNWLKLAEHHQIVRHIIVPPSEVLSHELVTQSLRNAGVKHVIVVPPGTEDDKKNVYNISIKAAELIMRQILSIDKREISIAISCGNTVRQTVLFLIDILRDKIGWDEDGVQEDSKAWHQKLDDLKKNKTLKLYPTTLLGDYKLNYMYPHTLVTMAHVGLKDTITNLESYTPTLPKHFYDPKTSGEWQQDFLEKSDIYPDSPEIRKTSCQPAARRFCSAHDPRWLP